MEGEGGEGRGGAEGYWVINDGVGEWNFATPSRERVLADISHQSNQLKQKNKKG